ncbi:unnamed protein product [Darwinula stevensoni]|uniref:U3 small nucleolar RNA-associated protein 13 C-terminal domain-containing protein n=1 Tax=Darwinula stevensoni TaxID=69355 RepID=A0A7R8X1F2_9CRUS|nr:unnamed protein product [Darwinula stevensoni]CAG0882194.1 unnamed protein product [Darwinula stevensoni]
MHWNKDGEQVVCLCHGNISVLCMDTGTVERCFKEEGDPVSTFVLSPDDTSLVSAHKSGLLRLWNFKNGDVRRVWKSFHIVPVSVLSFDQTSTLVASGGSDSCLKVWDVVKGYCTHNLRGAQGIFSIVKFHSVGSQFLVFGSATDSAIRAWDLKTSQLVLVLQGHLSTVTDLHFIPGKCEAVSCGRDKVWIHWNLEGSGTALRTTSAFESLEGLLILDPSSDRVTFGVNSETLFHGMHLITVGSRGQVRMWHLDSGQEIQHDASPTIPVRRGRSGENLGRILQIHIIHEREALALSTDDCDLFLLRLKDFTLLRQYIGYADEILDVAFVGRGDEWLAVASNSPDVKIYSLESMTCRVLHGHKDIVLCLARPPSKKHMLASGSKDGTFIIWVEKKTEAGGKVWEKSFQGVGHTGAVTALAFSLHSPSFIVSSSDDHCLKLWDLPHPSQEATVKVRYTLVAHDKVVNSCCVSPNDRLLATGSQDHSAKVWNAATGELMGTLRGHSRGIWCVQFSPVDQVLASGSTDSTIRLWALNDFSCLKTFEGHSSSVLKLHFLSRGMQIVSCGSDGLLKIWNVKTSACTATYDEHEDKVWALAVNRKETHLTTGGADSKWKLWKDTTEEELEAKQAEEICRVQAQQTLSNLIQDEKYLEALTLAIKLEQPYRALTVIQELLAVGEDSSFKDMEDVVKRLKADEIDALLRYVVSWNTRSRTCHAAQVVLNILLQSQTPEELLELPSSRSNLEGLLPYTRRHLQRFTQLKRSATFLDFFLFSIKPTSKDQKVKPPMCGQLSLPGLIIRLSYLNDASWKLHFLLPGAGHNENIVMALHAKTHAAPATSQYLDTFWFKYILSATAASLAEIVTFPLDLVKTRLQIQGEGGKPHPHRGFLTTSLGVIRDEGPLKLWRGLTPAIYRHVLYSGIRLSVYERLRERGLGRNPDGSFPLWKSVIAGMTAGACGQFIASPADLVKVQMQTEGRRRLLGLPPRISSGFISTVMSTPMDVMKTRIMNQPTDDFGRGLWYQSTIDCLSKTVKQEGFFALYKGFFPTWARLAPWTCTFWAADVFTVIVICSYTKSGTNFLSSSHRRSHAENFLVNKKSYRVGHPLSLTSPDLSPIPSSSCPLPYPPPQNVLSVLEAEQLRLSYLSQYVSTYCQHLYHHLYQEYYENYEDLRSQATQTADSAADEILHASSDDDHQEGKRRDQENEDYDQDVGEVKQKVKAGLKQYKLFGPKECQIIENQIEGIVEKGNSGALKPCTLDRAHLRNKYFFGEGYTYGNQLERKGQGMERLFPPGQVDSIPAWIFDLVVKPLEKANIVPKGWINSVALNYYEAGGCIVSHIDPMHIFDRGFAADNITHCIRPQDVVSQRAVIILRRVHDDAPRLDMAGFERLFHDPGFLKSRAMSMEEGEDYITTQILSFCSQPSKNRKRGKKSSSRETDESKEKETRSHLKSRKRRNKNEEDESEEGQAEVETQSVHMSPRKKAREREKEEWKTRRKDRVQRLLSFSFGDGDSEHEEDGMDHSHADHGCLHPCGEDFLCGEDSLNSIPKKNTRTFVGVQSSNNHLVTKSI